MLKLLKKISPSHEELFIEHYDRMRGWSLQLTEHDRDLAEDLLHDAFIHFTTLTQPDLKTIRNLDGYLYMMLRNLHISQERRSSRARFQQLSIVEYESAATGLRTIDSRDVIRVQDDLRRVCLYACGRKEKAKLASVLILRFFHGYYPSEIAQILRSPRAAIDKWLQLARAEAKLALADTEVLKFKNGAPAVDFMPASFARSVEDLLRELRQTIFLARQGECFQPGEVSEFYRKKDSASLNCERLSHVVSCEQCLNEINHMLKLPPLSERYPTDSIGKDTSSKGGGPGGEGGSGGAGGHDVARKLRGYRRDAREAFEHHPTELCVSVNGYIQGSHKISSELSEFDLSANLADEVSFVEVFSEQGIRLLLLNAEQPPPEGSDTQTSRANLSDGRSVDLTLRYRSSWPTLHLIYRDPTFKAVESYTEGFESGVESALEVESPKSKVQSPFGNVSGFFDKTREQLSDLGRSTLDIGLLSRPATVTAVVALLALAILLLVSLHRTSRPALIAANLLQQSVLNEEAIAARPDQVVHRTITLEERKSVPGAIATGSLPQIVTTRKIEIWRSAEKRVTARRLYDDRGQLIAGDWRRADGVQTIYHHGSRPQLQLAPEKRSGRTAINFENIWQLDIAAKDFSALIGNAERAKVEEQGNAYVISVDSAKSADSSGPPAIFAGNPSVVSATLVLNRNDLHATEMKIVVSEDSNRQSAIGNRQWREYRFVETAFEKKRRDAVAPSVFEPEPELTARMRDEGGRMNKKESASPLPPTPLLRAATADDEVEVLSLLNQAGVFLRDQVSVNRSPAGQLIVSGIVENDERKRQIATALSPMTKSRVARVEIETVAEVLQRQQARAASEPVTVQGVQVTETNIPIDAEAREYLSGAKGLFGEQLDHEVRQFSERMLARSNQARLHALALKPVIERFSSEELQALTPAARAKWRSIVIAQVRSFAAEIAGLRRELAPLFPSLSETAGSGGDFDVANDADFVRAVRRLMELASTNDESVRRSFSVSTNAGKSAPVRGAQFWRTLSSAESLAAKISSQ